MDIRPNQNYWLWGLNRSIYSEEVWNFGISLEVCVFSCLHRNLDLWSLQSWYSIPIIIKFHTARFHIPKSVGLIFFWLVMLIAMSTTNQNDKRPTDFRSSVQPAQNEVSFIKNHQFGFGHCQELQDRGSQASLHHNADFANLFLLTEPCLRSWSKETVWGRGTRRFETTWWDLGSRRSDLMHCCTPCESHYVKSCLYEVFYKETKFKSWN